MADTSQHIDPPLRTGSLLFSGLTSEIQRIIINEAISCASNNAEVAGFAAVNSTWQIWIETATFRHIDISLRDDADHFITILTPARAAYLKHLTIQIEWPFYLAAQATQRFSGAQASARMTATIKKLAEFLAAFNTVATGSAAHGLNIALQPVKAAIVDPSYPIRPGAKDRRSVRPPVIPTMWSANEMLALSRYQRNKLPEITAAHFIALCPILSMVTGLAFPPDFFAPPEPQGPMSAFLTRFPNLTVINLTMMGKMDNPDSWRTDIFETGLDNAAPQISELTLTRTSTEMFSHSYLRGGYYISASAGPGVSAYIDAIRNYTRNLERLRFDRFASPVAFYTHFFNTENLPDQTFQWAKLKEVNIVLYGEQIPHRKQIPMTVNSETHLGHDARTSVISLFYSAGAAAAKMPRLMKMTIHIPRQISLYLMGVTLRYTVQSRRDASLGGIWGSPGQLDLWAAPRDKSVEDVWTRSISRVGKVLRHIEWHDDECYDDDVHPPCHFRSYG